MRKYPFCPYIIDLKISKTEVRIFKCFDFFKCRWRSALPLGPPHAPKEAVAPSRDEAAQARLLDARRVLRVRER